MAKHKWFKMDGVTATTSLGTLLARGGVAMWPIYLCSAVALTVFLQKVWTIRRMRLANQPWTVSMVHALKQHDLAEAAKLAESVDHPVANVLRETIAVAQTKPEYTRHEATRMGRAVIGQLESYFGLLAFVAQAAPLLGLLGTVIGMVELFMSLQMTGEANVAVAQLAGGIWKALLTTAAGLTVAVPALAGHQYLVSQADRFRAQLGDLVERIVFAAAHNDEDA